MTAIDSLRQYWNALSRKERLIAGAAGAALLATSLYPVLLGPGLAAREQLAARLPVLRAQIDDMQQQQKEIAALRKKLGAASQRGDLKTLLQTSAARTSFVNAVERLDAVSGEKAIMRAAPEFNMPVMSKMTFAGLCTPEAKAALNELIADVLPQGAK